MISRRSFIKVLGLGAAYLSTGFSVAQATYHRATYNPTTRLLTDFGGLIHKPVKGMTDSLDVALDVIKNKGVVHPRGTGHSCMGKSMRQDALIYTPEDIDITFKDEIVYASGGTTLLDIDNYLDQHGYMLPTTPDHRDLSLGGVISVGGYGIECCRYGALVDSVESIDLLDTDGTIWRDVKFDSPQAQNVLCGLGGYGAILSAGIRCVPKPKYSLVKSDKIPDVDYYIQQAADFIDDPKKYEKIDIWHASWSDRGGKLYRGKMMYDEDASLGEEYEKIDDHRASRKKRSDGWVFRRPYQYYIWTDIFFTIDNFKPAFERALEIQKQGREEGGSVLLYSSIGRGRDDVPKTFPHYDEENRYLMSIGIFANYTQGNKGAARNMARAQMEFSKEAQEKWDGRQYRYGWEWQDDFKV